MIQLNLLPDVKADYVHAQRTKRAVITISFIVSAVAIGVVVLLSTVAFGAQKVQLNSAQDSIDESVQSLNDIEDLDKVLTIQNQLESVIGLHTTKPDANKLFFVKNNTDPNLKEPGYIQKTAPSDITIDTFTINFEEYTVEVSGSAPSINAINKYVDTLKFTAIKTPLDEEGAEKPLAFSEVVLASFSTDGVEATYSITLKYDPNLFSYEFEENDIEVPLNTITTRSEKEQPGSLFKKIINDEGGN